jgi:hypothetical protein
MKKKISFEQKGQNREEREALRSYCAKKNESGLEF